MEFERGHIEGLPGARELNGGEENRERRRDLGSQKVKWGAVTLPQGLRDEGKIQR